ncbi:hypothetical protein [Phyllobacterium chamaecytisi]|uniref:hypothetical protein n=1 Tax=Phyllobacterium chamaecytisi TaxID=2876082 RepID=UPI001CCAC37C|nr:hypothetical protein [Phyllobacterium sp. KW56]MBZ9603952.1 hypothetical protein [Phyllobacterium sp. KW56]
MTDLELLEAEIDRDLALLPKSAMPFDARAAALKYKHYQNAIEIEDVEKLIVLKATALNIPVRI